MSKSRRVASLLMLHLRASAALAALALPACSSAIDMIPSAIGGLPANAPPRPEQTPEYPNIYATPAPRETRPLTAEEQKQLEKELTEIRDRQTGAKRSDGPARSGDGRNGAENSPKNRSP